ncbi:hypothetical protein EV127DRAFT_434446 [Xylaria flabelliformis]|nr:hypothetical protein EV127DRAFT_434446 [Xylaria flabelliformis]
MHHPSLALKLYARKLLEQSGGEDRVGKTWHRCFLDRHPEIRSLKSRNIDYKRATAATTENIHIFFGRFDSEAVRSIPKDHVWNKSVRTRWVLWRVWG